jgi:hypothetical protein
MQIRVLTRNRHNKLGSLEKAVILAILKAKSLLGDVDGST